MMARNRQKAERSGRWAETVAMLWLSLKGYRILGQRLRGPIMEIDILARRGAVLVAVEVKFRKHAPDALLSITPARAAQLARALEAEAARRGHTGPLRVDLMALAPWRWPVHKTNLTG